MVALLSANLEKSAIDPGKGTEDYDRDRRDPPADTRRRAPRLRAASSGWNTVNSQTALWNLADGVRRGDPMEQGLGGSGGVRANTAEKPPTPFRSELKKLYRFPLSIALTLFLNKTLARFDPSDENRIRNRLLSLSS